VTVESLTWGHLQSFRSSSLPLILTLRVKNPNSFSIRARSLTYAVRTREDVIIHGTMATLPEFPSEGETLVHVPLSVSPVPLINSLQKSIGRLSVDLTVYGSITLESFAGDIQIPFRKEMKKNLKKILSPGRNRTHR